MVGTSQLPSLTISRPVTMLRDSMMSVGSAPRLAKKVMSMKRPSRSQCPFLVNKVIFYSVLLFYMQPSSVLLFTRGEIHEPQPFDNANLCINSVKNRPRHHKYKEVPVK